MASYTLINSETNEKIYVGVGEIRFQEESVKHGTMPSNAEGYSYANQIFLNANTPTVYQIYKRGECLLDLKDREYWKKYGNGSIYFENQPRVKLMYFNETNGAMPATFTYMYEDEGGSMGSISHDKKISVQREYIQFTLCPCIDGNTSRPCALWRFREYAKEEDGYIYVNLYDTYNNYGDFNLLWDSVNKVFIDGYGLINYYRIEGYVFGTIVSANVNPINKNNLYMTKRGYSVSQAGYKANLRNRVFDMMEYDGNGYMPPYQWQTQNHKYYIPQQINDAKTINAQGYFINADNGNATQSSAGYCLYWLLTSKDTGDNPYEDDDNPGGGSGGGGGDYGGGDGERDDDSDVVVVPGTPGISVLDGAGVSLYRLNSAQLQSFKNFIWGDDFVSTIIKLFQDPMDAIIFTKLSGIPSPTGKVSDIVIGNVDTLVQASVVYKQFEQFNFGTIHVNKYYGDYSDYLNTRITIHLPFIGSKELSVQDVMDADITLYYTCDFLSGSCLAILNVQKTVEGTQLNASLYEFTGNFQSSIPMSATDTTGYLMGVVGAVAAGQFPVSAFRDYDINSNNNISESYGIMGSKQAYITIHRPIHRIPQKFNEYVGYKVNGYVQLAFCSGLTICSNIFIDNVIGSVEETREIKRLLMEGVLM